MAKEEYLMGSRERFARTGRIAVEALADTFDSLMIQTGRLENGARKARHAIERRVMSDHRFSPSMEFRIGSDIHMFQFTDSIGYVLGDRNHPGKSYGQLVEDGINATGLASARFTNLAEPGADMKTIADKISDPDIQEHIAETPGMKTIFIQANGNNIRPIIKKESDLQAAERYMRNPLDPDALRSLPTLGRRFFHEMKEFAQDYYRGLVAIGHIDTLSRAKTGDGVSYVGWLHPTSAHRSEQMQFVASDDVEDVSTRHVPIQELQLGPANAIMFSAILTALKYRELTKYIRRHNPSFKVVPIPTFDIIDSADVSFPDEHWPEEVHTQIGARIVNAISFQKVDDLALSYFTSGKNPAAK